MSKENKTVGKPSKPKLFWLKFKFKRANRIFPEEKERNAGNQ